MTRKDYSFQAIEFDPFAGPEIEKAVPATAPQMEIWASYVIGGEDANRSYNESVSLYLEGHLDQKSMEKALIDVVNRHEALRSGFSADGKKMCVFKDAQPAYQYEDISHWSEDHRGQLVEEFLIRDASTAFNLLTGPLVRVNLFKIADNIHHLTISAHHIICDGWSTGIVLQDLGKIYSAYVKNEAPDLDAALSFADYAVRQNQFQAGEAYRSVESYWLNQYKSHVPVLDMPTDYPRPEIKTYKSHRDDYELDPELVRGIKKIGAQAGSSLVTTMLVAFEVFLHKVTGQDDVVLGVPSAGQSAEGNYNLVGHCVNMLPLRSRHDDELSFIDFLKIRRPEILDAYENQPLTFGALLHKLGISRNASRVPLIPVVFNIDIGLDAGVKFDQLVHKLTINKREFENFEIFLNASGTGDLLTLEWSYNTQLFNAGTVERMMADFKSLLSSVVGNPDIKIGQIPFEASDELNSIFYKEWNNTDAEYPKDTPLHKLIEKCATENPERIAVRYRDRSYTYRELNEASNRLAFLLLSQDVKKGDCVGLAIERSPEMLISLLAILKSGAVYVPLDPSYPKKRIEFMLSDSGANLLITTKNYQGRFSASVREILIDNKEALRSYPGENPSVDVKGNDLAYILYTSGSSGQPKGTQIEHHSVVNFLNSMRKTPGIGPEDRLLAVTTISFDIAGLELYLPLIAGAELIIADDLSIKDGRILADIIKSEGITMMQATPSTWKMIIDGGWNSKLDIRILCGGEALPADLANKLLALGKEVWNMYGPTETTIWSAIKRISPHDGAISLGRPIDNTRIYILDKYLKPVLPGLAGVIYIAGDGLARGYLNRPDLTAASFLPDPFSGNADAKMYCTGDLGKFNARGEICYLGRIDNQVKIRGHRIELGAIEHALNTRDDIRESLVVAREDTPGDPRLVAYIVPGDKNDTSLSWQEKWEDLYRRGIEVERDLDIHQQQLDVAVAQQISGRNDIREEVVEWLAQSVQRIKAVNAKNVVELGCGAGQLIFEIAPLTQNFIATDYAQPAIDKLKEKLASDPEKWKNVRAFTAAADDLSMVEKSSQDLVIINGVVQYFPDVSYLVKVIEGAANVVKPGGCIYIGDMQGKSTLSMYHAFDQLQRSDNKQQISDFKKITERRVKLEDELVADPLFFYLLPGSIPSISSVEVQLREGSHVNETTKYHYDVWLYTSPGPGTVPDDLRLEWDPTKDIQWITRRLEENQGKIVKISGIYNKRTAKDHSLQTILESTAGEKSVGDVRAQIVSAPALDPHELWQLGNRLGYTSHIRWSTDGSDGLFEGIFIPRELKNVIPEPPSASGSIFDHARSPFAGNITVSPETYNDWKRNLSEMLPDYMIPADFVVLDKMPLLPNGKIDRSALPRPEKRTDQAGVTLPATPAEELVVKVWSEVLGLDSISAEDDFFELGGHSLIAVQVMIRMEKETGLRLPLTTLFKHSTVKQFAVLFLPK